MASPSTLFPVPSRMPAFGASRGRIPRPQPVSALARFAFWTLLLLSLTNVIGFIIIWMRRLHDETFEFSIYPVIFAVCTVIVLTFSKARARSKLLLVAWAFWLVFFLGGFLGSMQITALDFRASLRVTLKPWMTLVGLPWLALRAISEDKLPRLIHVTVLVTCAGAVVGLLQLALPGFMTRLMADVGRAEGLWANPNTSGSICAMALFLSFLCPFKSHLLNWSSRLLLLAGVGASLSRVAILALVISWAVYTISARRFGTLVKSSFALLLFVAISLIVLGTMEAVSEFHEQRIATVRSMLSGKWDEKTFTGRTELWGPALDAILSNNGLLFGLGHGAMGTIVESSNGGLAPHNCYLYVLGNSGLFALIGLLAFHFTLFQQSFKCPKREQQAALLALATYWALAHFADDTLIGQPMCGAILACIVVTVAYARPRQLVQRQAARPIFNGAFALHPR
jgi:O-antigen ligase